jgi:hypothetical protein
MNFFATLFRRPARPARRRTRRAVEALEAREVLSGTSVVPPADLTNPTVARVAKVEYAESRGTLTRRNVIDLLSVVDGTEKPRYLQVDGTDVAVSFTQKTATPTGTVGPGELTSLRKLVKDASQWNLTADVTNLLGKVVNYNLANETYNVNNLPETLLAGGKLKAGDPETDLVKLVDKWFEGDNLPLVWYRGATYEQAQGSLFGPNGPQAGDVAQGRAADCYFLSALGEAALKSPRAVKDMFTDDGGGIYTVRFFQLNAAGTWVADYVTVNSLLPMHGNDKFVYANTAFGGQPSTLSNPNNILWVALAEKAYAQLAAEGRSRGNGPSGSGGSYDLTSNSYSAIDYGYNMIAEQQITGFANAIWVTFSSTNQTQAASTLAAVEADFQAGDLVTFATWQHIHTKENGLIGYHVYYMTGYDAQNQTVTLTNPYTTYGQRTVTVTLGELETLFQGAAVVVPNS